MKMDQLNQFSKAISGIKISRSRFTQPFSRKFTMNAGELVPCFVKEALPGDTLTLNLKSLVRMATPIYPVMDNAYMDVYFFFVPSRILWDHLEDFYGQSEPTAWNNPIEYTVPQLNVPFDVPVGTVYDYMCLPVALDSDSHSDFVPLGEISVNVLPFRAYGLIWNEWFRDQNQYPPIYIPKGDSDVLMDRLSSAADYNINWSTELSKLVADGYKGGKPLPVAKFHDYFTSALPSPQKGEAVSIPLGVTAPVITGENNTDLVGQGLEGLHFFDELGRQLAFEGNLRVGEEGKVLSVSDGQTVTQETHGVIPANLYTDLSTATAATINSVRMAFTLQRLQEREARGGSRFFEILQTAYGVTAADSRIQRPEYLGGKRIPINISQVLQQLDMTSTSERPLGSTGAYSLTFDSDHLFTYSSVEPGYFIGVCCIRTNQSYSQGIHRMWSRKRRYDFYDPVFANLPEQPILNKEIYAYTHPSEFNNVFGYQEAWAEYRYSQNEVCGYMRPGVKGSLDVWHYGNDFKSMPTLSAPFIAERPDNIDRTLAVTSNLSHQFICDFYYDCTWVRPMPMYSIPGMGMNF